MNVLATNDKLNGSEVPVGIYERGPMDIPRLELRCDVLR